jgi:hypothetical protein
VHSVGGDNVDVAVDKQKSQEARKLHEVECIFAQSPNLLSVKLFTEMLTIVNDLTPRPHVKTKMSTENINASKMPILN